ncbi:MAG: biotin/lipoyl-binding protein [Rhizobiaceae bacterium]
MKIERERPCQRRHLRLTAPLFVTYEGQKLRAKDWSLGGIGLAGVKGRLPKVDRKFNLQMMLPFQGYDISFDVDVEVVRTDKKEALIGFRYVELPQRSYDLLSYFSEDLIRGQMGTIDDSICRIDVPVTPISTKPSADHISETPIHRLPIRTIMMSTLYIIIGLLVFSHTAILIYSNFMRLEIPSSVVSTQLQTLKMPMDGIIRIINFSEGERVKAGDKIFQIDDLKLNRQINAAKLRIEEAKSIVWQVTQKHEIETERLKLYQIVSRTEKNIAKARLSALREALKSADAHYLRMVKLRRADVTTINKVEEAKKLQVSAAAEVKEAELLLERDTAMSEASSRRHYNHKVFITDLDMLAVELEVAYSALKVEVQKLQFLDEVKARNVVRAPFDGRIISLYKTSLSNVFRNEPLLLLERENSTTVTAYLNQSEILEVGLNDEAKVFIPALDRHISAMVTKIDRSSLYLNKNSTQFIWRNEKDRTAAVILDLLVSDVEAAQIRAGLPVVVIFDRRETNDIWSVIKGFVGRGFIGEKEGTGIETDKTI